MSSMKSITVQVPMTPEQHATVKAAAAELEISVAQLIRTALRNYLGAPSAEPPSDPQPLDRP